MAEPKICLKHIPMHPNHRHYADDEYSDSSESSSLHAFDALPSDVLDLEDGFDSRRRSAGSRRKNWWQKMVVRARRKISLANTKNDYDETLLPNRFASRQGRRTCWYKYCIFGGISGLTILSFLLFINLSLGIATLIWSNKIDSVLKDWGKPGTGTEGLAWYPTDFLRDIIPIPCHSHNDYWRRVPLFDALRAGCTGVEADVWLFDEELYVGHNTASLTRNRTFSALYVDPLVKILKRQNPKTDFYNGTKHGVFDTDPGKSVTLLVDVKTGGVETWRAVLKQLEPLRKRGWLTYVENNKVNMRPITVVGTGNTPFDFLMRNSTYRDTFFDAPLEKLWEPETHDIHRSGRSDIPASAVNAGQGLSGVRPGDEFNRTNSYYASVSFGHTVGRLWRGRGKLGPKQMKIIRGQIRGAHKRGLKVRYWDTPSWPIGLRNHVWDVLVKEGADILNVDDLRAASKHVW